ncbi:hypothetical protein, partial [Burkholderia vietnamiensis]|uniref:hypothetical protein n=1 Tax=Burkholderia vietnamiensis TaxID=60552 RepID=UPI001C6167A2
GIRFIHASVSRFYETLASTFFSRPHCGECSKAEKSANNEDSGMDATKIKNDLHWPPPCPRSGPSRAGRRPREVLELSSIFMRMRRRADKTDR